MSRSTAVIACVLLGIILIGGLSVLAGDGEGSISRRQAARTLDLREFHALIGDRLDDVTITRIFNAADANGDGELNLRELRSAKEMIRRALVRENGPDKDGDGYLSLREFNAWMNGRLDDETVYRIFNAADRDGDEKLSRREIVQARRLIARTFRDATNLDIDGDGYLSLREFNAWMNGRLDAETVNRIFNAADRNDDGKLCRGEFIRALRLVRRARSA